uniref:Uncharacterized protein n=1 Tax=Arundo donax TaxID=35708 RepID=A0A0A9ANX4_ARUDO
MVVRQLFRIHWLRKHSVRILLLQLVENNIQRLPVWQRRRPRSPWHQEPLRPRRARGVAPPAASLAMARSIAALLDPALLGRLDLLLVAAAALAHQLLPVGVVRVRGGRWGPAVVLVRG